MQRDVFNVWQKCLDIIKVNLSPESFHNWFKPIEPVRINNNKLTIRVPSPYYYEYLEENYIDVLRKALKNVIGPDAKLVYEIVAVKKDNKKKNGQSKQGMYILPGKTTPPPENRPRSIPVQADQISNPLVLPGIKKQKINSNLKAEYNFENFIEGDCNRAARSAGLMISDKPGIHMFNPLMIFGPVGTGKTHLAQAIGIRIKERFPELTVLYTTADKFETQFTTAIQNNNKNKFIEFYQMIDVLILDDIHEFAKKEKTQLSFFHIFNSLHQRNKQLILTSDRPPAEMHDITERLLSRLKWGLTVELKTPNFETRLKILKHKAYQEGIDISEKVLNYIAEKANTNLRELEGVLYSIIAYSTMTGTKKITPELVRQVMKQIIKENKRVLTIDYIVNVVADFYGIEPKVIKSKARSREIVLARQIAMYLSREFTDASLTKIGSEIGGRDHSTVLYACKTIKNLMESDKNIKQRVESIVSRLKY